MSETTFLHIGPDADATPLSNLLATETRIVLVDPLTALKNMGLRRHFVLAHRGKLGGPQKSLADIAHDSLF